MNNQKTFTALCLTLTCGVTAASGAEKTPLLRGRVTNTQSAPAPAVHTVLSPFGMSTVAPNGQVLGTMNTTSQSLPAGTVLVPSAIGPVVMGPRGEIRGTMASLVGSQATPPIGLGPTINYSTTENVSALRQMFAYGMPYPMTQGMVVMPMGAGQNATMPMQQESSFARVLPREVTGPAPQPRRLR